MGDSHTKVKVKDATPITRPQWRRKLRPSANESLTAHHMLCHPESVECQRSDHMRTFLLAGSGFTYLITSHILGRVLQGVTSRRSCKQVDVIGSYTETIHDPRAPELQGVSSRLVSASTRKRVGVLYRPDTRQGVLSGNQIIHC